MATPVVDIKSMSEFETLLTSPVFVVEFYKELCEESQSIAPLYESMAKDYCVLKVVAFGKIDTDKQRDLAAAYAITGTPTFMLFVAGKVIERVHSGKPQHLKVLVSKMTAAAADACGKSTKRPKDQSMTGASTGTGTSAGTSAGTSTSTGTSTGTSAGTSTSTGTSTSAGTSTSTGTGWCGASIPRGYADITGNIEKARTELLNVDDSAGSGTVRVLFDEAEPSLSDEKPASGTADWVESDTDEQLMLFLPLQTIAKLHTLQITSHATEAAARPQLIKLYSNSPHNLGFDEADDMRATQEIELTAASWNDKATASIPLKFVKFQNTTSLVVFVVSAEGGAEKVRLDRVRLIGEAGEKREMGKLEKIGDEAGE